MEQERFNYLYEQFVKVIMETMPRTEATRNRVYYLFGHLSENQIRACMYMFRRAVEENRLKLGEEPEPGKWAFAVDTLHLETTDARKNHYCEKMGYNLPNGKEKSDLVKRAARIAEMMEHGTDEEIKAFTKAVTVERYPIN